MTDFDPEAAAAGLGLQIMHQDPGHGRDGLYIPRHRVILLKPGMHPHQERVVCTHEIKHHETGTKHTGGSRERHRIIENRCDLMAARELITVEELTEQMHLSSDMGQWAVNLRVTGWVIDVRMKHLSYLEKLMMDSIRGQHDRV